LISISLSDELDANDSEIRVMLSTVLNMLNAKKNRKREYRAVCSQEILTEIFEINQEKVTVIEETYMGIELNASRILVSQILKEMHVLIFITICSFGLICLIVEFNLINRQPFSRRYTCKENYH